MFCTQIVFDLLYNMTCIRALNYEGQQCPTLNPQILTQKGTSVSTLIVLLIFDFEPLFLVGV